MTSLCRGRTPSGEMTSAAAAGSGVDTLKHRRRVKAVADGAGVRDRGDPGKPLLVLH